MHEAPSQKSTDKKREAYRDKGKSLLIDIDNFVSIDVETTGLSPRYDEIIELGAVRYRNGVQTESFSSLCAGISAGLRSPWKVVRVLDLWQTNYL